MTSVVSESRVEEEATKSNNLKSPSANKKENGILSGFLRLWPLGTKTITNKQTETISDSATSYYGVYVPCENEDTLHIYTERVDALKVMKKFKQARFKAFKNRQQAVAFALQGAEPACEKLPTDGPSLAVGGSEKSENGKRSSSPVVGEQTSQFKGPKPQEMVKLRKEIESGSISTVRDVVWENPRYLVSSGDTPSILHEGTRYNAMHVAAKSGNAEMCNLILSTVGDPSFIKLLYGEDDLQRCKDRATILLDLYINTPDKAMNETPLHLAVKFGFTEVVDLLTSYPQCTKCNRNKFGYLPKEVVCERAKTKDAAVAARISSLLLERFYVPVIHSEGDCNQPLIGEPFEPATPPLLNKDPLSPRLEIRAYAGPMQKQEALSFRKKWKTPPRQLREPRFRLGDVDKGLEKYGRNLAQQLNIGWKEYWPFLDTFTDLSSTEGLKLLEEHFKSRYSIAYSQLFVNSFDESAMNPHTTDANYSDSIIRKLSLSNIVNSDEELLSPITDLCLALKACTLAECNKRYKPKCRIQAKCEMQDHRITTEEESLVGGYVNPSMSPFLCIERSCQVFAKRMADLLLYALSSDLETLEESIKSETKHLQQTVASYMNDTRFNIVDFNLVHSRVAQLTALRVTQLAECEYDVGLIAKELDGIAATNRNSDIYSSDEEDNVARYRQAKTQLEQNKRTAQALSMHVRCLSDRIAVSLNDDHLSEIRGTVKSEEESMDAWAEVQKCQCSWQAGQFTRNCRKNASYKRNYLKSLDEERAWSSRKDLPENSEDLLSSSPSYSVGSAQRRLNFRNDHTDGNPESPVKHCLTIFPNVTDRNHNSSIVEVNQSITSSDDGRFGRSSPLKCRDVERSGRGEAIQEIAQVLADIQMKRLSSDLMSDDESNTSSRVGSVDEYFTPPSSPSPELADDDDNPAERGSDMLDVSDDGAVDVFIYGAVPTKTDRDVFEAILKCPIDSETYPNLYRWRHQINMYPETERMSWQPAVLESPTGPLQSCQNLGSLLSTSTPVRPSGTPTGTRPSMRLHDVADDLNKSAPPLQIASWLRVTGPNSPKSALANRKIRNNISLGF